MNEIKIIELTPDELREIIRDEINQALRNFKVNAENTDEILTIEQAANFLKLTKPTIYSKCSRRELPHMKRNKRLYFSKDELMNYLKEGKTRTYEEIDQMAKDYILKRG